MQATYRLATRVIAFVILGAFVLPPVPAADDYLSALEAEADDTGSRGVADTVPVATAPQAHSIADNEAIREGLDLEAFEAELDANYSGTWFLYVKLSTRQRKAVYEVYLKDNSTSAVREEVVRQLASS